jgi:TPR repeat protein
MNWKTILILAAGAILLSGTVFAQTHGDNTTKNQRLNGSRYSSRGRTDSRFEEARKDRIAAERGDASAQFMLALRYDSGRGVPQDHAEAAKWYRKAAELGFASAQKNLGVQYGLGQGVPQSNAEAFIWSSIAAKSGDEGAVTNRDFAASQLSPTDLEAAQKRALTLYEGIQQRTEGG